VDNKKQRSGREMNDTALRKKRGCQKKATAGSSVRAGWARCKKSQTGGIQRKKMPTGDDNLIVRQSRPGEVHEKEQQYDKQSGIFSTMLACNPRAGKDVNKVQTFGRRQE